MVKTEKIGTVEWATVKTHARRLYVNISGDLVNALGLKKGDRLKIKIEEAIRA